MEHLSTSYFRNLLAKNVANLKNLCKEWDAKYLDSSVPEEVRDEIRTTIGLTNLLLSQKLKQFQGLIDDSDLKRGEKEITCLDLQGFWDMVYNEVEKIEKRFANLEKCQKNNWIIVQEDTVKMPNKKKCFKVTAASSISSKNHASAAHQRLAEAKLKMRALMILQKENVLKRDASSAVQDANSNIFVNDAPHRKIEKKEERAVELRKAVSSIITKYNDKQMELSTKLFAPKEKDVSSMYKTRSKIIERIDKLLVTESESKPSNVSKGRGTPKEVKPLQRVTRSAIRAMLARQNETQKN